MTKPLAQPRKIKKAINSIIQKWYYGSKPLEYPKMEPDLWALVRAAVDVAVATSRSAEGAEAR